MNNEYRLTIATALQDVQATVAGSSQVPYNETLFMLSVSCNHNTHYPHENSSNIWLENQSKRQDNNSDNELFICCSDRQI